MATINPTITRKANDNVLIVTWASVTETDSCAALTGYDYLQWADRTVEFAGTWDGATGLLQGSNVGSAYTTLNDPTGTDISATDDKLFGVLEVPPNVKPSFSGGGATQSVTVTLVMRRQPLPRS